MFLLLILIKYEIIILAAGPADTKNIKLFCFASSANLVSNESLISSHFSTICSGIGKNLYAQDISLLIKEFATNIIFHLFEE